MKAVVVVFEKGVGRIQGTDKGKVFTKTVTRHAALKFLAKSTGFTWKG